MLDVVKFQTSLSVSTRTFFFKALISSRIHKIFRRFSNQVILDSLKSFSSTRGVRLRLDSVLTAITGTALGVENQLTSYEVMNGSVKESNDKALKRSTLMMDHTSLTISNIASIDRYWQGFRSVLTCA